MSSSLFRSPWHPVELPSAMRSFPPTCRERGRGGSPPCRRAVPPAPAPTPAPSLWCSPAAASAPPHPARRGGALEYRLHGPRRDHVESHGRCTRLCLRAIGPLVTRGPAPHHPSALINGFSLLRRPRYSALLKSSTKALYFTTKCTGTRGFGRSGGVLPVEGPYGRLGGGCKARWG
jgi:hypothetical protein